MGVAGSWAVRIHALPMEEFAQMRSLNRFIAQASGYAPVVLRLAIGSLFLYHGIDKFDTGLTNVEGFFASEGVPAPAITAPLTAVAEVAGGIALILGAGTRLVAAGFSLLLVGAFVFVKSSASVLGGSELDIVYLAGTVALVLLGSGRAGIDQMLGFEHVTGGPVARRELVDA